ncbi:box C/D snoRNA protein 1 isoform X2 [Trichosurus vulpecula]|uniref:box C/D snoRNA protein 1 isoform X2 n=1 Tax=Trichosurus vulpecula TaxID=9337 RepID=UPI00186B1E56|nr:box C/D snoRNA protein 1 isoform X2 [Trichosurus vulpecula]
MEGDPEGPEVKQEVRGAPEVKREIIDGIEVKQELIDGVDVKQELIDGVDVKQELIDDVDVKQELVDGVDVKHELIDGVDVKQELIDGVDVKQELIDGVEVKQELMDEPQVKQEPVDGVDVKEEFTEGVDVKQEPIDRVDVKEEPIDGVEVKEEPIDGVEVKEELMEGVDMKQEPIEGVEVKEELIDGLEAMEEVVCGLQMKEEMLEEGIPAMSRVHVKEEVMVGEVGVEEVIEEMTVKEEEVVVSGGLKVEEELMDGIKMEEEMVDGMKVKEEMENRMEVKQEAVQMEVKEEENGMEVKTEVNGMEMKKEGVKEEAMHEPEVKEEEMDGARMREGGAELTEEQEPPGEPQVGSKRKLAMSSCETCGTEEAKYRCPRCMKCSCSLACVKKHKTQLTCNGIREKTAFVSLKQFTEINLLSDYRFLEDVGRSADYIARDIFLKRPSTNRILNYMKNRARRHNIDLRILPIGFTKRRENSTVFDRKEQRFYWHLKLLFPQSRAEYVEKGVPGDKKLNEILRTYIDPEKSDPVIRQRLKAYVFSESGVLILMKIENMQHNLVRYYELDPCKSLIDNLKDKVVIEYPTLHVVLKGSKNDMIILGQERNESTESFGSENPALSSEEEGEIQESS